MDPDRIPEEFPAPSFRGHQEATLERVRDAYRAGNDVVIVRAPTGSGKSLLARAIAGAARTPSEARPSEPTGAYYTTPQVSQLEDVAADELLSSVAVVRGKSNYTCLLPGDRDTPVDRAPCARRTGWECDIQHRCPYFADRNEAATRSIAGMTLAYFMHTAGSDVFGPRDVVVIDEAHGLAEWAELYATVHLGPRTLPDWAELTIPLVEDLPRAVRFAERLANRYRRRIDELTGRDELDAEAVAERDRLQELIGELEWFVEDARDHDSPTTWLVDQAPRPEESEGASEGAGASDGKGTATAEVGGSDAEAGGTPRGGPITIKPMDPARFLAHTVWDRGERFGLLSATILDREAFCRQVGLDPDTVALVDVAHTFPLAHRRLYDVTCGKMTYAERSRTLPALARTIARVMARHPDEKGLIHAHSYDIQHALLAELDALGVGDRLWGHDRGNRDDQIAAWLASAEPTVFVSVKMEEALDLAGDLARWQVLCKAPYPNTRDSRVAHRLADDQWGWYYRATLRTVIQACGRIVRSPEDRGATYLADSSLLDCFERGRGSLPPWFAEQVDAMTDPELPALDPAAALAGLSDSHPPGPRGVEEVAGARSGTGAGGSGPSRASSADSSFGSSGGSPAGASPGSAAGTGADDGGGSGPTEGDDETDSSDEASANEDRRTRRGRRGTSPLADVWETDR